MTITAEKSATRERWIDVAKGVAILLVVATHAQTELHQAGAVIPAWPEAVDDTLATLRMPLFFLVSGLFARRALVEPWPRFARAKLARFGWLYLLWSVVTLAAFAGRAAVEREPVLGALTEPVVSVLVADDGLWYLVALPVFFGAARLCRGVPVAAQLVAAGVLSAVFALDLVSAPSWGLDRMPQYLVWFLAGCYGSGRIRDWAVSRPAVKAAGFAAAWGGATLALRAAPEWAALVLPLLAVPCAVAGSVVLRGRAAAGLAWLGRHTLPVYVLHSLTLAVLVAAAPTPPSPWSTLAAPALTAAAVALSLGVWLVLRRRPWLFDLPARGHSRASASPV